MICTLSKQHAESRGYDDALMFDWRGQVAEATGANVFFVTRGRASHADARLLPRRDHAPDGDGPRPAGAGSRSIERAIWPEELESFEQMFLTGTARRSDVRPVGGAVEFRGRRPVAPAGQGLRRPGQRPDPERLAFSGQPGRVGDVADPIGYNLGEQ